MPNEDDNNRGYRAYLVRLWPARSGGQIVCRASVEDVHSGERRAFANLTHLFAFLHETASSNLPKQDKECSHD